LTHAVIMPAWGLDSLSPVPGDALPAERLAATTLALVDIPSESLQEAAIAEYVVAEMTGCPLALVHRDGETLFYEAPRTGRPLVILAGHLDTVPAQGNIPGRIDGDAVHGLGASDMKGGVAVLVELGRWLAAERPPLAVDLALLFFPREELPPEYSALPGLFATYPAIREASMAIVLEPTDNTIQAGCLGNLNAELVFRGESAHSARPWLGRNAIDAAVAALAGILPLPSREVIVGGLTFVEVATVTEIAGGIASNVVPDRVTCMVNFRYAPDCSPAEAEKRIRELLAGLGEMAIASNAPPARVATDSPLVQSLRAAGNLSIEPKQAWTPVAEFDAAGIPAVNFGPGATRFAHRADERVEVAELVRTFETLCHFLLGTV
jgi:succinyl-diaminopimelate desuccinylase